MNNFLLLSVLFFMFLCSSELRVPLPNNYTWCGAKYANSDVSQIANEHTGAKVGHILDIFVHRDFVYGCFSPQNRNEKYFILNTKTQHLQKFKDANTYINALNQNKLPLGLLDGAVNMLEIRKGHKSVYWNLDE